MPSLEQNIWHQIEKNGWKQQKVLNKLFYNANKHKIVNIGEHKVVSNENKHKIENDKNKDYLEAAKSFKQTILSTLPIVDHYNYERWKKGSLFERNSCSRIPLLMTQLSPSPHFI